MKPTPFDWRDAASHVASRDRKLGRIIRAHGDAALTLRRQPSPFHALMQAIIYQQLSGKAAATIHKRLCALMPRVSAANLLALDDAAIRGAGVSAGKMKAVRDLARRTVAGEIPGFARLQRMPDDEIIERLTAVYGVGRWTVEMLLIFDLGRPDVLPVADLGVQKGLMISHKLPKLPTPAELAQAAERWRPFRTVGSWYCWRATDA